ncbi:MAG: hypothetical protein ACM3O3_03225 [Syntrophothermus sp.]
MKNHKIYFLFLFLLISSTFLGCLDDKEACIELVKENLKAAEEENVDAYLKTIDPNSPSYVMTKSVMTNLFNIYDLEYKLIDASVLEIDEQSAKVRVVFTTRKIKGPQFNNNKVSAVHYLTKVNDEWKINSSVVNNIESIQ